MKRQWLATATLVSLVFTACAASEQRVVVAAGTTLVDSGFLDAVKARYQAVHPGTQVSVVGLPTGQVLELGRQGAADLLITHAPDQEAAFVAEGRAARVEHLFASRFVLLGPPTEVSALAGLSASEALARIAEQGLTFVGRGDGSGTAQVEAKLWKVTGVDLAGQSWYVETGLGMGPTIQVADQRAGFVLSELGAFLAADPTIELVPVNLDPAGLDNPYTAIVVEGGDGQAGAFDLLDWLLSEEGRAAIEEENQALFGQTVYG